VIAHENGDGSAGTAHGSGRSISAFHLLDAIESCRDLFTRFGGHAHAVGFSLPSARVEELRERLCRYAAARLSEEDLGSPLECDAVLPLDRVTPAVLSWLRRLEPMGMGNAEPVFLAQNVRLAAAPRYMKEKHVRLQLAQGAHRGNLPALGWNWAERVHQMQIDEGSVVHLAYKLRENEHPEFGGLELEIAGLFSVG
jgi:single-stranded-DNA-specific exonuclease